MITTLAYCWAALVAAWLLLDISGVSATCAVALGLSEHALHEVLSVWLDTFVFAFGEVVGLGSGAETVAFVQASVDPERGNKRGFFLALGAVYVAAVALYALHIATDTRWKRAAFGRTDTLRKTWWFARGIRGYFPGAMYADVSTGAKGTRHLSFCRLDGSPACPNTEQALRAALRTYPDRRPKAHAATGGCFELASPAETEPARYLVCCHPHGLFTFGTWCTFNCWTAFYDRLFDGRGFVTTVHTLATNFRLAIWREILIDMRFSDADRGTMQHALGGVEATYIKTRCGKSGKNDKSPSPRPTFVRPMLPPQAKAAVGAPRITLLVPGGAEESVNCTEPRLLLGKRKGFVRIALQTGASLVPMYTFGETELYRPVTKHPLVMRLLLKIEKIVGVGTPMVVGHDLFNLLTPRRRALRTVFGKPIDVRKYWRAQPPPEVVEAAGTAAAASHPGPYFTDDDVDALHGEYVAALEGLFAKYRPKLDPAGPPRLMVDGVPPAEL